VALLAVAYVPVEASLLWAPYAGVATQPAERVMAVVAKSQQGNQPQAAQLEAALEHGVSVVEVVGKTKGASLPVVRGEVEMAKTKEASPTQATWAWA